MIITGHCVNGQGDAHRHMGDLTPYFNCPVIGTFNIKTDTPIDLFEPAIDDRENGRRFWLVRIDGEHYAWAYRWRDFSMPLDRWEIVSKSRLPEHLREGELDIEVLEPLGPEQARAWARRQDYWFQSFPWSPQRADSELIWRTVTDRQDWSGRTVLDIGCHYGYHSFRASKAGASVTGMDLDHRPIETARFINDHIEMQDVQFGTVDEEGSVFDVILYFSVHHQFDPSYDMLVHKLEELRGRAREQVFVELITPSLKGGRTMAEIDAIVATVGGRALHTYQHKVRHTRRIYELEGLARDSARNVPRGSDGLPVEEDEC